MTALSAPARRTGILCAESLALTTLSDSDLGERLWDAWNTERTGHPVLRDRARRDLALAATEARRRGHRVLPAHFTVGQRVHEHQESERIGTVVAIEEDAIVVQWPAARTPGVADSQRIHATCLLDGSLVAA